MRLKFALIALLFSMALWANGQKANPGHGKIIFKFEKPSDSRFTAIYQTLVGKDSKKKRRILYGIQQDLTNRLALPNDIVVTFKEFGRDKQGRDIQNAFYSPDTKSITFSYEIIFLQQIVIETYNKYFVGIKLTREDKLRASVAFVLLHELGHAIFDQAKVGSFGKEEDAADEFGMQFLLTSKQPDLHTSAILSPFLWHYFATNKIASGEHPVYSDEHAPDASRYYDLLSLIVGRYQNNADVLRIFVREDGVGDIVTSSGGEDALHPQLSYERAKRMVQQDYEKKIESWYLVMGKYLRSHAPLFRSRSADFRFLELGIGLGTTAQQYRQFKTVGSETTDNAGFFAYIEPRLNLTNHFSMGLKIQPTLIGYGDMTTQAMPRFGGRIDQTFLLPVMLTAELRAGKGRLRPFIGLSVGVVRSGGVKNLDYTNLKTNETQLLTIPAKLSLSVSPRIGFSFGHLRIDSEYNLMAGLQQSLNTPTQFESSLTAAQGMGSVALNPYNFNHFTIRLGVVLGGGHKE